MKQAGFTVLAKDKVYSVLFYWNSFTSRIIFSHNIHRVETLKNILWMVTKKRCMQFFL